MVASSSLESSALLTEKDVTTVAVIVGPALPGDDDLRPTPGAIEASLRYGVDFADLAERAGFTGEAGTTHIALLPRVHSRRGAHLPWDGLPLRIVLLGSGSGGPADLRHAGAALAKVTRDDDRVVISLAPFVDSGSVRSAVEGYLLGAFRAPRLTSQQTAVGSAMPQVVLLVGEEPRDTLESEVQSVVAGARGTWLARQLTALPSDVKTPQWVAARAGALADQAGLEYRVWDEAQLSEEGFGGIAAVSRGSSREARLVTVTYEPVLNSDGAGQSADVPKPQHVVLVGKGMTYDSGGLALKPRTSMVSMKSDMAGAAVALATVLAAADSRSPHRVTAVLPLAENALGGASYRPGDVIRTYDGTTVEITNPDAEGQIVLSDALGYARLRLEPDLLIDIATLTGATTTALGHHRAALFTTDEALAEVVAGAGARTGEQVWRLPLVRDYRSALDSELADIRQTARGDQGAGAIMAGLFMQRFAGDTRWAHLDIAGTARSTAELHEVPEGATGFGVRLLLETLAAL